MGMGMGMGMGMEGKNGFYREARFSSLAGLFSLGALDGDVLRSSTAELPFQWRFH